MQLFFKKEERNQSNQGTNNQKCALIMRYTCTIQLNVFDLVTV